MPHIHFIVNPAAGGNTCIQRFREIERTLQNISYSVAYSEYAGHAEELAKKAAADGFDYIVAVGGDGTAREVALALTHTGKTMGILPLGTGNDLIRSLDIPSEPSKALELLLNGNPHPIDTMTVNGMLCLNVAGFGFDVEVLQQTLHYKTRFHGPLAYLLGLLHAIFYLKFHKAIINTDKGLWEEDILLVAVGNGTHIGGGINITPLANPADGLLDLCIVSRVSLIKAMFYIPKFIRGDHLSADFVKYHNVKWIDIKCNSKLPVQLDGEIISSTPISFKVQPASLQMITGSIKQSFLRI